MAEKKEGMLSGMLSSTGLGPVLRIMPWIPAMLLGAGTAVLTFLALVAWYGLTQGDDPVLYEGLMAITLLASAAGLMAAMIVKVMGRRGPSR